MRKVLGVVILLAASGVHAAPNVLNNSAHAAGNIAPAINVVLGAGHVDTDIFVDMSSLSQTGADSNIVALATDTGHTNYSAANNAPTNHAPYALTSNSYSGWSPSTDQSAYATSIANGLASSWAFCPFPSAFPAGTPPPVVDTTILQTGSTCFSSAGSGGLEFNIPANYKGLDTSSPSGGTATFSGLLMGLKYNHPTWNWQDIKGALRQTASNWATGWATGTGFGDINYDTANAVASSSAIYLQGPLVNVTQTSGNTYTATLYPYRQTRRVNEAVYVVSTSYSWPAKNEYTLADITASGATLLYTSNGTDINPTFSFALHLPVGNYYVMGFTLDGSGGYSRVDGYTPNTVAVLATCH
jgi:hypothetical protein